MLAGAGVVAEVSAGPGQGVAGGGRTAVALQIQGVAGGIAAALHYAHVSAERGAAPLARGCGAGNGRREGAGARWRLAGERGHPRRC